MPNSKPRAVCPRCLRSFDPAGAAPQWVPAGEDWGWALECPACAREDAERRARVDAAIAALELGMGD